jgi:hypothetical protein
MPTHTVCSNDTPLWHIIIQVGPGDDFFPVIDDSDPRLLVSLAKPDPNAVGNNILDALHRATGRTPAPHVFDLLHLATAVFAADLRVPRHVTRDRWRRRFHLYLPAFRTDLLASALADLNQLLEFLTGDEWSVDLRDANPVTWPSPPKKSPAAPPEVGAVTLFSGGLDSLVGTIDLLDAPGRVAIVGHHGKGFTSPVQHQVLTALQSTYPDRITDLLFYVQPPKHKTEGEQTMRSRSLLFLSLGTAACHCLGWQGALTVPENGFISLNVPLTKTRLGSTSTRTTHPSFLAQFNRFLEHLSIPTRVHNPYHFQTKGQMLAGCRNPTALATTAPLTMSCSHPELGRYHGNPGHHCGYCYPCLIRRAAIHVAEIQDAEYDLDVLTKSPPVSSTAASNYRALQMAMTRFAMDSNSMHRLQAVATGTLPQSDLSEFADVYVRGMAELTRLYIPSLTQ